MEKGIGSLMGESGLTMSNMDMMMADQGARQGISPAEQRMMMIQKTATDMGRTISDRDAQLFGMGEISFEEAMSRATSDMDMQQENTPFIGTLPINQIPGLEMLGMPRKEMAEGDEVSKFPDLTGDGKVTQADILKGRGVFQEGGAVEGEIDKGLEELQGVAPEAMVIQQVMTMVMEMIQSGASEEQIVAALKEMGMDDEDIQQVMMMVASEMQGQDSIDGQLAQMM